MWTRAKMAEFFEPSIRCIVEAIISQTASAHHPIGVSDFKFTITRGSS